MDKPINPLLGYGIIFGAMILAVAVAYMRHLRYERELDREDKARGQRTP